MDPGALERLYRAHAADVRRFVASRVAAQSVADVCQEVWAAVAAALAAERDVADARLWILGIARHKSLDGWRQRETTSLHSDLAAGGVLAPLFGVRSVTTPSRELSRVQRTAALRRALDRLDAEERELVHLRFVLGLKPGEIVALLGAEVAANTISQRIVRAVRRLRRALADDARSETR